MSITDQPVESVLDQSDPGDETLKRFRYQITYAALLAAFSQEENSSIDEIFCEFHEDVLIKHLDKEYTGVQIKTRDVNLPPFTIEDEGIKNSCKKFVILEKQFNQQFKAFSIVSNIGFDKSKSAACIQSLLDKINSGAYDQIKDRTKAKAFIRFLMAECNASEDEVYRALKKVRLKTFCSLDDIHMKLMNQLRSIDTLKSCTESQLDQIADLLVAKAFKSSSLYNNSDIGIRYVTGVANDDDVREEEIKAKKLCKREIENWLNQQKTEPVTILLKDRLPVANFPREYSRMQIKMDAGGLDSGNIDLMRDLKFSFENLIVQWVYKNDKRADQQYNQVLLVVYNICKEIIDELGFPAKVDANQLLISIRHAVKKRHQEDPSIFFDCKYEHVIGSVGVLTEMCKLWWSNKFDIA